MDASNTHNARIAASTYIDCGYLVIGETRLLLCMHDRRFQSYHCTSVSSSLTASGGVVRVILSENFKIIVKVPRQSDAAFSEQWLHVQ